MKILIVDDEKEISDLVQVVLSNEGYDTAKFYSPSDALEFIKARGEEIGLAVLDVMMPKIDGFALCREIRKDYTYPVIMLTARAEDVDKITGLSIGADDYVTKPFNPLELVARVKAQIRRYTKYNGASDTKNIYDIRGLFIDAENHVCRLYDEDIPLTPTEFSILHLLCESSGRVVSSEEIFEKVWGEKYLDSNNTVMVHIRRIREKLREPARNPRFIKTVWGVGYKIEKDNN